ncbi:trehalose 6-phosphatase [Arthrobacter alpinus]|uniref:Trehalose 6-phosphate phosphatase n=1 Tax=Arthrobacter alpinus TaxID=656366 RepID=A0A1H5LR54_9MICC|nr:trehalose-phosphatase [Arthrobacter alpinus]SEE79460.1 trehalose 6-phosphatase [Arthrobacter alpinus]
MRQPLAQLPAELESAIHRIAQTPHLLLALDFDGTMAPIVEHAADARPLPRTAAALAALSALEGTTTALVSGRALGSLRMVAAPPAPTLLVGSHGAETWLGPDSPPLVLTAEQSATLELARAAVAQATSLYKGTVAEDKPAGVALHYRLASKADGHAAVELVMEALSGNPAIHISTGKKVLEISVIKANKGQSLAALREYTQATATLFAGDDVTDEHGFEVLRPGDVGIKVGKSQTHAEFRIPKPQDLPMVLELLLAARSNGRPHTT